MNYYSADDPNNTTVPQNLDTSTFEPKEQPE